MIRITTLLLLCLATPLAAQRIKLTPVDQAKRDPSLVAFRAQLLDAIAQRDSEAVIDASCDQIYLSHGGNGGHDEFRQYLTLSEEMLSEEYRSQATAMRESYWKDLEKTLQQPGYFESADEFWMPFHWQLDLPDSIDVFEAFFVTGTDVTLRSSPSSDGRPLGWLSYEVVTVSDFDPEAAYQEIRVGDGRVGFMHQNFLWAIVGYRASFIKSGSGDWQLCNFVAGD